MQRVEWRRPIESRVPGTLGQAGTPAPPGWTGPWPPPKPPFWDLTGLQWLPTGDFPAQPPFGWQATGLPWPPPRPPGYPASWDWPLKPPPGWLPPPATAPAPTPVSPPPGTPGSVPSSSSSSGGDSVLYVIGGLAVVTLFGFMLMSGAALQENPPASIWHRVLGRPTREVWVVRDKYDRVLKTFKDEDSAWYWYQRNATKYEIGSYWRKEVWER